MTARNVELLERVMQHIDDHPEQHDQAAWINECGTAACFAGWAVMFTGGKLSRDGVFVTVVGESDCVSRAAGRRLGISAVEGDVLFDASNTRDMLRLMVKDLVNGDELRTTDDYLNEAHGGAR